ncbi:putative nucleotide-diphospho-sugar transferase [Phocaeicola sp.]
MKTKIVYILVSRDTDIYLEQAYISMFSVKYHMADAYITLVIDKQTEQSFKLERRNRLLQYINELITVDVPSTYTAMQRSRILKTSARKYVKGDFLFVDTDTIVLGDLSEVDDWQVDIAACQDSHASFAENPYRDMCMRDGKLLGWPINKEKIYFNSGVLYVKDNVRTHEFYQKWNENWLLGTKVNVFMDQPSFAKTNYEFEHIVEVLDDVWNCELKHGIRYLKDAKILHYLCTNISRPGNKQIFLLNEKDVFEDIKKIGLISNEIKEVINDPFKGIVTPTHLFSGQDLYFFKSGLYTLASFLYYHNWSNFIFNGGITALLKIFRVLKRYLKKTSN